MASKLDKYADEIYEYRRAGHSASTIAEWYGVGKSTVSDWLRKNPPANAKCPQQSLPTISFNPDPASQSNLEKILFVPDTHAPFEDDRAWDLVMAVGAVFEPDVTVHMGDLVDFYTISAHSKSADRKEKLHEEVEHGRYLRYQLDMLSSKRKVFIEGNHEYRITRFIDDNPKLASVLPFTNTDEALDLTENGWEFVPYKDYTQIGKLYVTHDAGVGGKYTAARAIDQFKASAAVAHHHQMQYFVSGDARGNHQLGVQFGWLGDAKYADYLFRHKALTTWSLGFGVGYHDTTTGLVYVVPVPIIDYTCVVEGVKYDG